MGSSNPFSSKVRPISDETRYSLPRTWAAAHRAAAELDDLRKRESAARLELTTAHALGKLDVRSERDAVVAATLLRGEAETRLLFAEKELRVAAFRFSGVAHAQDAAISYDYDDAVISIVRNSIDDANKSGEEISDTLYIIARHDDQWISHMLQKKG